MVFAKVYPGKEIHDEKIRSIGILIFMIDNDKRLVLYIMGYGDISPDAPSHLAEVATASKELYKELFCESPQIENVMQAIIEKKKAARKFYMVENTHWPY